MKPFRLLLEVLVTALAATLGRGAEIPVSSASEIANAMTTAQPGDVLVMQNGVWMDQAISFEGDGTQANPITLRAETPGEVILSGTSRIEIGGTWLVVDGLVFENGSLDSGHIVRFRRSRDASNCRLTNTVIRGYNPPDIDTRYFWVSLYGTDNRVDHCLFENHNHSGVTVVVWGDWPNRHLIDNNIFKDRPEGPENGWETIRLGTSEVTQLSSQTIVESNLFLRANGEIEAISDKTQDNIHRYNTFRACAATLTLRHATNARVYGNFFLGEDVSRSGGIRVIGPGHRIWNNYFQDLRGRTDGIIAIEAGESNGPANGYEPVTDCVIAHNTFIDCGDPAFALNRSFGGDRDVAPSGVLIVGNAIDTPGQNVATQSNSGVSWDENIAFANGRGTAPSSGVTLLGSTPFEDGGDGLMRPKAGSALIDAVSNIQGFVADDMDGQARAGLFDAGADEVVGGDVVRGPLTEADTGPDWIADPVDPPGPSSAAGIEAENYFEVTDPSGDGDTFTVESVGQASGGQVIKAPDGERVDPPGEPQDALAIYEVVFSAAGTYTMHVRARGFSGSTDSLYAPTGFMTDPTVNVTTSSNGSFEWEEGPQYTITAGRVGVTLEFRLGMREQDCEIDAFLFTQEDGLSDAELDAMLEAALTPNLCAADLDPPGAPDGELGFFDLVAFLTLFAANDPAADLDPSGGDGVFGFFDLVAYLTLFAQGCP